jgi:hypothetical protein
MNCSVFAFVFLLSASLSLAQSDRPKEFQIRGGMGISGYEHTTSISGQLSIQLIPGFPAIPIPVQVNETGGAMTVHIPLGMRYEITRRFNVGLDARLGSYLYDPANGESDSNKSNQFWTVGPAVEYNIVGRDNFRWYAGFGIHAVRLQTNEVINGGTFPMVGALVVENEMKWKGLGTSLNSGLIWFVAGGPFGLHLNLGYDGANMELESFRSTLPFLGSQDIGASGTLGVTGLKADAGVVLRIKMK